tara:strand:- start:158922 stop:159074 length:153 start_codon:yes stop_codon:yes gene_type:complete
MTKKRFQYKGRISLNLKNEIYLHVDHLEPGTYTILLMENNNVLKKIDFKK